MSTGDYHLKSLVKRARLNEGHVKAAIVYKARVAALTSEQAVLQDRMQNMTEEAVKLKSDLRHSMMARARAEGKEEKARDGLRVAEGELREVRDELQAAHDDLLVARDGLEAAQTELQAVRDELQSSQNELRVTRVELRAARDELRNKAALIVEARRKSFEAVSFIERLTEECHGLRGELQRQETLVVQRDGAIASLRDEACTQWASGWLAFQRKAAHAYPGLDLNFDIPSDEEAEESFSADCSGEPNTSNDARSPSSPLAPSSDV